jgi:WWE domain
LLLCSRGIYFAEKSKYSHEYAFKPSQLSPSAAKRGDRPVGQDDEREVFLVKLLVGEAIELDRESSPAMRMECAEITVPPVNRKTKLKYNTVTGMTGDSRVWVVYENGRAYPEYLVRYYEGRRDAERSPYRSKKEAMKENSFTRKIALRSTQATISMPDLSVDEIGISLDGSTCNAHDSLFVDPAADPDLHATPASKSPPVPGNASVVNGSETNTCASELVSAPRGVKSIWEFLSESGWQEYDPFQQTTLEFSYREFAADSTGEHATVNLEASNGTVRQINFLAMTEGSTHVPEEQPRSIRRQPIDPESLTETTLGLWTNQKYSQSSFLNKIP